MTEQRESRAVWWIGGGLIALLVSLHFLPEIENPLAPVPKAAYVALLPFGEEVATDGEHALDAGREFRLFAVLEATDWRDRTVYFTAAPALRLGGRKIASESLRSWAGGRIARVRWFTVEGFAPYLELTAAADLERFRLNENFHPEWGDGWSVAGVVDPKLALLDSDAPLRPLPIGTQRFQVRIELFDDARALTPARRTQSPGAEAVLAGSAIATSVQALLPPPLTRLSTALGRVQVESGPALSPFEASALEPKLEELEQRDLIFRRARLLARHLADRNVDAAALTWRPVVLAQERLEWGAGVGVGDLLQSGPRLVVLFKDAGEPGRLDPQDLVLDFWKGARVRRIDQVFTGDDGVEVELATLGIAGPGSAESRSAASTQ